MRLRSLAGSDHLRELCRFLAQFCTYALNVIEEKRKRGISSGDSRRMTIFKMFQRRNPDYSEYKSGSEDVAVAFEFVKKELLALDQILFVERLEIETCFGSLVARARKIPLELAEAVLERTMRHHAESKLDINDLLEYIDSKKQALRIEYSSARSMDDG